MDLKIGRDLQKVSVGTGAISEFMGFYDPTENLTPP